MIRLWLAIAGLGGLASVAAGALAAHLAGEPKAAELLRAGATYGMVHAAALIAVIALAQGRESRRGAAAVAGWGFAAGIVLFSRRLFPLGGTGGGDRGSRSGAPAGLCRAPARRGAGERSPRHRCRYDPVAGFRPCGVAGGRRRRRGGRCRRRGRG